MVRDKDDRTPEKGSPVGRRSFLRTTAAAAAAATALASVGAAGAASTVNLGRQGLAPGDRIDDYLDRYFTSGSEVHVPAGKYQWDGTGLGGDYRDAALVGDGNVVFENTADAWNENVFATGGDVRIANITVRGELDSGGEKSRLRVDCPDENATLTLDNVNLPDGDASGGRSIGMYVGKQHAGTIHLKNVHVEGFTNNGLYAGPYGYDDGGGGEVHVERSFFKDNNIDAVRLGGDRDSIRNSVIVQRDVPEAWNGARTGRGVRVRYGGDDITVENVHITSAASSPLLVVEKGGISGGSGTLRNVFVRNETDAPAVDVERGDWTGESIQVTGGGNTEVSGLDQTANVRRGQEAEPPATELGQLNG